MKFECTKYEHVNINMSFIIPSLPVLLSPRESAFKPNWGGDAFEHKSSQVRSNAWAYSNELFDWLLGHRNLLLYHYISRQPYFVLTLSTSIHLEQKRQRTQLERIRPTNPLKLFSFLAGERDRLCQPSRHHRIIVRRNKT
jgi:hypothetical protein